MLKAGSVAQYIDMSTPIQDANYYQNLSGSGTGQRMLTRSVKGLVRL